MLFSIVVPVYNVEKYISRCMESLLNQNYSDFEIILVDDGSTDSCPAICDNYAKTYENVRAVHQVNGGLSDARNTGIKCAKGEYICFVDSDDYWSTYDALIEIEEAIKKSGNPDIVRIEKQKYLIAKDQFIENGPIDFSPFENLSPPDTLMALISSDMLKEAAWLLIPRRDFLLRYDLFFKKGIKSEDIEWSIRLYSHEPRWGFVSDRIYVYGIGRADSITTEIGYNNLLDCCNSLKSSLNVVKDCGEKTKSALMAFILYNLTITCAHIDNSKISDAQRQELDGMLKPICDAYIKKYAIGKKNKLSLAVYKVGGYKLMEKVLGFYLKNRGR